MSPMRSWPSSGWCANIVGLVLNTQTGWNEVAALLTRSYSVLAPKKLAALVDGLSKSKAPVWLLFEHGALHPREGFLEGRIIARI